MSNYTKITDFAAKDALAPGNPSKIVTGTAHDDEYNAIAVAIATKADSANASFTGTFTLGGVQVTATATELNLLDGVTATQAEINYLSGVTSAIQTQFAGKASLTGAAFTGAVSSTSTFTGTDFIISSDGRLKYDVRVIRNSGDIIDRLNGYTFKYRDSDKPSIGFIAQEVQQVLPELVFEREDGYLGVAYAQVVAVLVEEVKALRARVAQLEAR